MWIVNAADELAPYFGGEESFETALERAVSVFEQSITTGTFTCDICKEVIFPKVTVNEHGIFVESSKSEIRGGLGNRVLKKNVCEDCERKLRWEVL